MRDWHRQILRDRRRTVLFPLYKKEEASDSSSYRPPDLLSHVKKMIGKSLRNVMSARMSNIDSEQEDQRNMRCRRLVRQFGNQRD